MSRKWPYKFFIFLLSCSSCFLNVAEAQQPKEITNSIGIKLALISNGTFEMGSPPSEEASDEDERLHKVNISRDYYLGVYEVTQAQYEKVMGKNPSYYRGDKVAERHPVTGRIVNDVDSSSHPVESLSWEDAVEFCKRLSALPEEKAVGRVYRLPSEAEWEYACRAGTTIAYSTVDRLRSLSDDEDATLVNREFDTLSDDEKEHLRMIFLRAGLLSENVLLARYGWYADNSNSQTHPVGGRKPNAWGLYDMHGNVWEWCADVYQEFPKDTNSTKRDTREEVTRVLRGGSFNDEATSCRSANRFSSLPTDGGRNVGFRVALNFTKAIK